MRGGAGGVPGGADRAGRAAAARRPDHRDQRRRHDLLHPRTGEYDSGRHAATGRGQSNLAPLGRKLGSIWQQKQQWLFPLSLQAPPHPGQMHRSLLSVSQYHYCSSAAPL